MTLRFSRAAEQELAEATAYSEEIELDLGVRFREEVQNAATSILSQPRLHRQRSGGGQRVNLANFPYYLAFAVRGSQVRVIADAHGARKPGYFASRLRKPPAP